VAEKIENASCKVMEQRQFTDLVFDVNFTFLDSGFSDRNYDPKRLTLGLAREQDDQYIVEAFHTMHSPIYMERHYINGEYSLIFTISVKASQQKKSIQWSLVYQAHASSEMLMELIKQEGNYLSIKCPLHNLKNNSQVQLDLHFAKTRRGLVLERLVCTLDKKAGDDWCNLLYRYLTQ
jgi:hypothetical protein